MKTITTERLIIRRPKEADLHDFLAYRNDPESLRLQPVRPMTDGEAARFLAKQATLEIGDEGGWVMFALELRNGGRMIGEVGLYAEARPTSLGNTGWSIHPEYQGQGYATEAAPFLLTYAFEELDLHRVTSDCDVSNVASARIAERLGMRREGHYRQAALRGGVWCDNYQYALLRDEWLAR